MKKKGKFIVIYGINNIGKTTQVKKLSSKLNGFPVKYAVYGISPSGPEINAYLRLGNREAFSPREFQLLQIINRTQYNSLVALTLSRGINVVAEDYIGTGIAWGMGAGVNKEFLLRMNSHLPKEDIAILMDGERFTKSIEAGYSHKEKDDLVSRVRQIHLELAKEFGWHVVNADQPEEKVHADIWRIIEPIL